MKLFYAQVVSNNPKRVWHKLIYAASAGDAIFETILDIDSLVNKGLNPQLVSKMLILEQTINSQGDLMGAKLGEWVEV